VLIAAGGIETRTTPGPGCGPGPRWCRHAAGWARLTPSSRQSGETARPGRTGKGNRYLRGALGQAAMTAARTDTRLGAMYRRIARKRGKQKAIVATQRTVKAFAVVSVTWNDRSQTAIIRA
jgi:transposase